MDKCLLCDSPLLKEHAVRLLDKDKKWSPVFYCDNIDCPRYGLLTIYKKKDIK